MPPRSYRGGRAADPQLTLMKNLNLQRYCNSLKARGDHPRILVNGRAPLRESRDVGPH